MNWSERVAHVQLPEHWAPNASSTWDEESDIAPDAVLSGQMCMGGCPFHVQAIRVTTDDDGVQRPTDPAVDGELERLFDMAGEGRLATVSIPGHEGAYVLVVYPHGA